MSVVSPRKLVATRLLRRPWCWRKRIPIPFTAAVDEHGVPSFRVEDRKKVAACARKRLCQLCGSRLDDIIVFMGGAEAVRTMIFRQPPFHEECARVAVLFCPYLRSREVKQHFVFVRAFAFVPMRFPMSNGGTTIDAFKASGLVRTEVIEADENATADMRQFGR